MSSIWGSPAMQEASSPFAKSGIAPTPGGGNAARFQALLQSSGNQAGTSIQAGESSNASRSAAAASRTDSTPPAGSAATITSNDFLTLLVTEMQNQDPTAQTDPNEYINQLVQINSLEQLISINQNLTTVLGAATSHVTPSSGGGTAAQVAQSAEAVGGKTPTASSLGNPTIAVARPGISGISRPGPSATPTIVPGNLNLPQEAPAARTMAHALDGHPHAYRNGHAIRDIPTRSIP